MAMCSGITISIELNPWYSIEEFSTRDILLTRICCWKEGWNGNLTDLFKRNLDVNKISRENRAQQRFYGKMSSKSEDKSNGFGFSAGNQTDEQSSNLNPVETDLEIEQRLGSIFERLDRNGNGRINIQDLTCALKGVGMSTQYAEVGVIRLFFIFIFLLQFTQLIRLFYSSYDGKKKFNRKKEINNTNCHLNCFQTEIPEGVR